VNISDEIKRLHELHQAGALSAAEFEQAKAKLLNASIDLYRACAVRAPTAGWAVCAAAWAGYRAWMRGSGAWCLPCA
jgi:hypothetical protein